MTASASHTRIDARHYRRNTSSENDMTQEQDNVYRIQPDEFVLDPKDPFANDLMGRKAQADMLVKLATSVSGPAVIAVDAPYGVGKSTFLRMFALSPELRDAAKVIEHNAWKTEFGDMPSNSLSREIITSAQSPDAKQLLKGGAVRLGKAALPIVGRMTPLLGVYVNDTESTLIATNVAEALVQKAPGAIASIGDLRKQLNQYTSQKRIVIIIDELDRCTPDYAIETLEAIHHVFDSDGITFVLGLHRQQLMESIKAIYGQGFDAEGYLDRFIDLTIPLSASRDDFIKAKLSPQILFDKIPHFKQIAAQTRQNLAPDRSGFAQRLIMAMPNINARSIDRFAKNLIAMMNVMPTDMMMNAIYFPHVYETACTALAVKIQSPSLYRDFNENRASDKDIYNLLDTSQLPFEREISTVAAILIMAHVDISLVASSLSEDARRQQRDAVLASMSSYSTLSSRSEIDEDTLNETDTILKTYSPLYAQLCEQFGSIPNRIEDGLRWVTISESPYSTRKISLWRGVTNIIDLTT